MPYGMEKNDKGEWFTFNREYKPLGWNTFNHIDYENFPVHVKYSGLTEAKILKLVGKDYDSIHRDDKTGEIVRFYLYDDVSNPTESLKLWDFYFEKIKALSSLKANSTFV